MEGVGNHGKLPILGYSFVLMATSFPCSGTTLSCGVHPCPSKCHQLYDHSKMPCEYILYSVCSNGHNREWKCHKGPPPTCSKCDKDVKVAERKKQADFSQREKRDAEQRMHDQQLAKLD